MIYLAGHKQALKHNDSYHEIFMDYYIYEVLSKQVPCVFL